jgi:amino acid permease
MNNEIQNDNDTDNLIEDSKFLERESGTTVALGDISEEKIEERSWCKRTFGKMNPGSLRGSIFNLCILSLGTGLLAIPQKIGYMSIVFSPIIIILSGLANYWSLNILVNMSIKLKLKNYESIVKQLLGKKLSLFLGIIMSVNQSGIIILYQVILYKLLGGVINEIGNFGFISVDDFVSNSFWNKLWIKFVVCYGIMILFLLPLCLLHNASKMRYASTFGIISLFLLIIIVVAECPFYIIDHINNDKFELNYFDILSGLKGDMKLLQSIVTVFYAFSCHVGAFPVLQTLHNPIERRQKKVIRRAIYIDIISYLIIGASGYLTQPLNTPDLIIERDKLFNSDWIMTIGEICFIVTLLAKISANYNALRSCILVLLGYDSYNFSKITNVIITVVTLIITTLISAIFQSISDYISLIGSFCTVLISFFIPGLVYIKGNDYSIKHYKNILTIIFISIILILGLTSGFFTIKGIIN